MCAEADLVMVGDCTLVDPAHKIRLEMGRFDPEAAEPFHCNYTVQVAYDPGMGCGRPAARTGGANRDTKGEAPERSPGTRQLFNFMFALHVSPGCLNIYLDMDINSLGTKSHIMSREMAIEPEQKAHRLIARLITSIADVALWRRQNLGGFAFSSANLFIDAGVARAISGGPTPDESGVVPGFVLFATRRSA